MTLENLYATGATHDESGEPVCVVNVTGDLSTRARFHNCNVINNDSAGYGVVYMNGADTEWHSSTIDSNDSRAADGTIMAVNGRGVFDNCDIVRNESGRGTFHWDANGTLPTDEYRFKGGGFVENYTVTDLAAGLPGLITMMLLEKPTNHHERYVSLRQQRPWVPKPHRARRFLS